MGIEFTSESECSNCDDSMDEGALCYCESCFDEKVDRINEQDEKIEDLNDKIEAQETKQQDGMGKNSILNLIEIIEDKLRAIKIEMNK